MVVGMMMIMMMIMRKGWLNVDRFLVERRISR